MTKKEAAIITAFTGYLVGNFDTAHVYFESILKRPIFTHELADKKIAIEIKEAARADFLELCSNITDDLKKEKKCQ